MISLQQMRYLVILSEELQFLRASERCFVTQPTLSMQVKKAEEQLGHPIFDRVTQPLSLTPYGQSVIPILREILNENEKLSVLNEKMSGTFVEEIRIGIIPTISVYLLKDVFLGLRSALPNVKLLFLEFRTEELLVALETNKVDLALFAGPYSDPRHRSVPLYQEEIKIYSSVVSNGDVSIESLENLQPWLLSKGNCLRTQMVNFCNLKDAVDPIEWDYIGGSLEILVDMVNINGGYTLIPANYASPKMDAGKLKSLQSNYGMPAREILGVFAHKSHKTERLQTMLREIQLKYPYRKAKELLQILDWK
jgi:LysR family hydrogen peroxide-inducible transcriptional activator